MALGDGIRRNIAHVDPTERAALIAAIIELNNRHLPGDPVSMWFKQDEIHQATHVHGGPEFLPWHRELVNRFEAMIRQVNPLLSLHYWDWTEDPASLFTNTIMGSASGDAGEPWFSQGFYIRVPPPPPNENNYRGLSAFDITHNNPAYPPLTLTRNVGGFGRLRTTMEDDAVVSAPDFQMMRNLLENSHDAMHGYIGGTLSDGHVSFRDPFVFLLHSNVDRLFTRWQTNPVNQNRLNPALVYSPEHMDMELNGYVEPWSTGTGSFHTIHPWSEPGKGEPHTYKHLSVVTPPCYDTNFPMNVVVQNPGTPETTFALNFNDVPEGETTVRAASFIIYGCPMPATLRPQAGSILTPPFAFIQPASGILVTPAIVSPAREARIWLSYTAGTAEVAVTEQTITFECVETGQAFTFTLRANSIARPTVAVVLTLDQSGSMDWAAGTAGAKRIDVLKEAARTFVDVIQPNNGVGLIRFDSNAYAVGDATYPGLDVRRIGTGGIFDPNRSAAIDAVNRHATNLAGGTSIGDGLQMARNVLNAVPAADYQQKALIVFTDGQENQPLSIADVAGSIDSRTFAIGLGNESQVDTAKLNALTNGTGGYLLLSGILSASIDDRFKLSKYFLQILAGVLNNNVILDPSGYIGPKTTVKIPFYINEADIDSTVVLLTDYPVVDMAILTPNGDIINAANAAGLGVAYTVGNTTKNYRFTLPAGFATGNHAGTWQAVLTINEGDYKKYFSQFGDSKTASRASLASAAHGARYSVVVNTYSNLKMAAAIHQNSYAPSSTMTLRARLTEYGLPVERRANVEVEMIRPDATRFTLTLDEVEAGVFENTFVASMTGIYNSRFVAKGATLRGTPFTREQTLTGAIQNPEDGNNGGIRPTVPSSGGGGTQDGLGAFLYAKCCKNSTLLLILIALFTFIILLLLLFKR